MLNYYMKITSVPSAMVIIYDSGDLESPKSATLAIQLLFYCIMKTFKDFKSL
jgi:hypothetical protein